jgi:DNA modification methylase
MITNIIHLGDCLVVLKTIPDNSIDSICTDPPYELGFMGIPGINQESLTTSCSGMNFFVSLSQVLIYWLLEEHVHIIVWLVALKIADLKLGIGSIDYQKTTF